MSPYPIEPGTGLRSLPVVALSVLLGAMLLSAPGAAEDFFVDVGGASFSFSPNDLTIQVGDTVTWRNQGGGHNVNAPGFFRCANGCDGEGGNGNPSAAAWEFTRTFNQEAVIDYHCEPHQGIGMTGRVTVESSGQTEPGSVRFAAPNVNVSESASSATALVERFGGTDGAVSVDFATSDGSASAGADYEATSGTLNWADGESGQRPITITLIDDSEPESAETVTISLSGAGGGVMISTPSTATLRIADDDQVSTTDPGSLSFAQTTVSASESAGSVTVEVERVGGSDGAVSVDYSSAAGSASAGIDYTEVSGTLDWADGDSVSKSFSIDIVDDSEEESDETVNLALSDASGGAGIGPNSAATLTITDNDLSGECPAEADTLCLRDGRYQITVNWEIASGETGVGSVVDIDRFDSGLFFFFSEDNIEMLIKVLDGCAINDHFWVFFAATTDVAFELTVLDRESGTSKIYTNPLGSPANAITDTSAFMTCP